MVPTHNALQDIAFYYRCFTIKTNGYALSKTKDETNTHKTHRNLLTAVQGKAFERFIEINYLPLSACYPFLSCQHSKNFQVCKIHLTLPIILDNTGFSPKGLP